MILSDWMRNLLGTHSEIPAKEFNSPVFVTGCMRSGTTMLVNKLSQHPQLLKIGGELNTIWTEIGGGPVYPNNEYRGKEDVDLRYLSNMTSYYARSIEDAKSFKRHVMRFVYKRKTGGGRVKYDWDKIKVLNKSPHLINKTGYLKGMYPGSKLILIIRPIHEQVASMKMHYLKSGQVRALPVNEKESWRNPSGNNAEDLAVFPGDFKVLPLMWLRLNAIALRDLSSFDKSEYHIVKYEDLAGNQAQCMKDLFEFLQLDASHKTEEEKIINESIKIFNTSTEGDPRKKWEKHLTDEEKTELESILSVRSEDYNFIQTFLK